MYEYYKVINGIVKYIDNEIINKISGWKKWIVGSVMTISMSNTTELFNQLKTNDFVKGLGLIDDKDRVNVDAIYNAVKKQASKSSVTFDVPMLGALTLNEYDVDKIYELIKNEQ